MKVDYTRKNVLGTPLRIMTNESRAKFALALSSSYMRLSHNMEGRCFCREATIAARDLIDQQIRDGEWSAWDIHEPSDMTATIVDDVSGLHCQMQLLAFKPAEVAS